MASLLSPSLGPAWALLCLGLWLGGWPGHWRLAWAVWFWTPAGFEPVPVLAAQARHLAEALSAASIGLWALFAGRMVVRWTSRRTGGIPAAVLVAAGAVVALPAAALGLGLSGLFRPWLFRAAAVAGALAGLRTLRGPGPLPRPTAAGLAAGVLCLPALVVALSPETSYDALQYHLALPARYLAHGRIFDADIAPLSSFHLGGEMLLGLGQAVGGDGAARLLVFGGLPLVLALSAAAARAGGLTGPLSLLPWAALASSPLFTEVAGHAYTDLAAVAALCAAGWIAVSGRGGWALAGLLAGAAGAAKLNCALLGPVLLAFLAPRGRRGAAAVGWLLPLIPWIARNWATTGSPFGGLVLGSLFPAVDRFENVLPFGSTMQWVPFGHPSLWLWLPRFLLRDAASAGGECSPLLVALLPALFLPRRGLQPAAARLAPACTAATAVWALAGGGQVRWLSPVLPLAALAACLRLGASHVVPPRSRAWTPAVWFVAALAWIRICGAQFVTAAPLSVALGIEPPRAYLASKVTPRGWYMAVGAFLAEHPELGRPYPAGDIKAYYWPRDPLFDTQHRVPWLVRWARDGSPVRMLVAARQRRVGCVVHRMEGSLTMQEIAGGYRWTDRSLANLQDFVVRDLDPVWTVERPADNVYYVVYAVRSPKAPRVSRMHWLQLPYAELVYDVPDKLLAAGRLAEAERGYHELMTRYPRFAIPRLRLAEIARLRHDGTAESRLEREAARLLGIASR